MHGGRQLGFRSSNYRLPRDNYLQYISDPVTRRSRDNRIDTLNSPHFPEIPHFLSFNGELIYYCLIMP